jgi:hypothetical protein
VVWLLEAAGYYVAVAAVVVTVYVASLWSGPASGDSGTDVVMDGLAFALTDAVVIGIPTLGTVWLVAQGTRRIGKPWVTRVLAAILTVWMPGLWVLFLVQGGIALAAMAAQVVFVATFSPIWPPRLGIAKG